MVSIGQSKNYFEGSGSEVDLNVNIVFSVFLYSYIGLIYGSE